MTNGWKKLGTKKKSTAVPNAWKASEVSYLKKNFKKRTAREIAEHLGRTINAVRAKAATLGLRKTTSGRKSKEKRAKVVSVSGRVAATGRRTAKKKATKKKATRRKKK